MKKNDFTQTWLYQWFRSLLVMLLVLLPGLRTYADTFEYSGLTVTTDGVENTDYQKADKSIDILTSTEFTFSATSTNVRIQVKDGVQNAHIILSGYNCDRGEGWIGGPIIIGKNAIVTITLADGTSNTIKGSYETETMLINDGASVIINGKGSLTANTSREVSAGHGAAIQLNKTAKLTINSGTVIANSEACYSGEGAAIGGSQYGDVEECGTLEINGGSVTLTANKAAAFGGGTGCTYPTVNNPVGRPGGTLIMNGGTLVANGRIGGGTSVNGTGTEGGSGGSITINGGSVTTTMEMGSAPGATSAGSITLNGGTLTTPSVVSDGTSITFIKDITLSDNYTLTLPSTTAEGVTVTKADGISYTASKEYSYNTPSLVDGVYEIRNLNHLKWFRDLVNGNLTDGTQQNSSANATLFSDIDLNNQEWQAIGNYTHWHDVKYSGTFDGNYHTISNLKITKADYHAGLFGTIWGGHIKNLGVINADISGVQYAGSVISGLAGGGSAIESCYSVGKLNLSTSGQLSGITTSQDGSTIRNCYTSYSNISYEDNAGCSMVNCKIGISPTSYLTGELAYLLNTNKQDDETGWGQNVGTDAHPVALTADNLVYNHSLTADESSLTLNADNNRMKTLCYPEAVTLPDDVKAFTVAGVEKKMSSEDFIACMKEKKGTILPANTPVMLVYGGCTSATITLPAVTAYYDNNETESTIISQEGNLLKGTYSRLDVAASRLGWDSNLGVFYAYYSGSAYSCYLVNDGNAHVGYLATNEPIGDVEYAVLSEEEKTCYVSKIFYYGTGTSDFTLNLPERVDINGDTYSLVQFGSCNDSDDEVRFANCSSSPNSKLYIDIPKNVKNISKVAAGFGSQDVMRMVGYTYLSFSAEEVPTFRGGNDDAYHYPRLLVPYAAEKLYKAAWGSDYVFVSSQSTEIDLANGDAYIYLDSKKYYQNGEKTLVGTPVLKQTNQDETIDEQRRVVIEGDGHVALNNVTIGSDTQETSPIIYSGNNLDLVLVGTNAITTKEGVDGIMIETYSSESGTTTDQDVDRSDKTDTDASQTGDDAKQTPANINICSLSTGTLNISSGISSDNLSVDAAIYNGTSVSCVQKVSKETVLDTDNNQLAFSNYDFVVGPDNLVANGACSKLILNDAVNVYSPSVFKANDVTYRRTFTDNDFNALYLPFSASVDNFTDCEFYLINMFHQSDTDGDGVLDNITLEVGKVPAGSILLPNHPYLFKYKGTNLGEAVDFNLTNIEVAATETTIMECSSMSYKYEFVGNHQSKSSDDVADCYVIGIDSETGKTALVHPTGQLPAMRWAMKMTERESQLGVASASAPSRIFISIDGDGSTTDINGVNSENGSSAIYYDINGVRKSLMGKGVNLVKTSEGKVIKVVKR